MLFRSRIAYQGGVKIIGEGKTSFMPNLLVNSQGGAEEVALGSYMNYAINDDMQLTAGLWYRYKHQNAFAILLGFEYKYFGLGYSYDMASFSMNKTIAGSMTHEMTLSFKMDWAKKKGVDINPSPFGTF